MSDTYIDSPTITLSQDAVNVKFLTSSASTTHLHTNQMVMLSKRIIKDPTTTSPNQIT